MSISASTGIYIAIIFIAAYARFSGAGSKKTYIGFGSGQKILEGLDAFQHGRADAVAEKASD